ncbi:MAG: ATP synthase F1 subunit delta [Armatimonadota bacterium]
MIGRSVARRYLSAALEAAEREGVREELGAQLALLSRLVRVSPDLVRLLAHPTMPLERKLAVLGELLGAEPVRPLCDLVAALVDNDRLAVLRVADEVYQELADEAAGVTRAYVTTALPLRADQAERLRQALAAWLGRPVVLDARVDAATIGGIIVRVGDRRLDGSLRGRLQRIRAQMAGTT